MPARKPPPWQNERATGARKFVARPDLENPDVTHTGDRGDQPRIPYGLTEPMSDRGDATRHHDGKPIPEGEGAVAFGTGESPASKPD